MIVAPPQPARWFQLLVARNDLPRAMDLLARRRLVELEEEPEGERQSTLTPELAQRLERFRQLEESYRPFWPAPADREDGMGEDPVLAMDRALAGIEAWRERAAPVIVRVQEARARYEDLHLLEALALSVGETPIDLGALTRSLGESGSVVTRLFVAGGAERALQEREEMLLWQIEGEGGRFLLAQGSREAMAVLEEEVAAAKGRLLRLPPWVEGTGKTLLAASRQRLQACIRELRQLEMELVGITDASALSGHLGSVVRMRWFLDAVEQVVSGEGLAYVTGWTDSPDGENPTRMLREGRVRGLMGVTATSRENPPLILANPPWARPFEFFARLLGMPARHEADPSRLLALLAPLLFGYMFGDVGQGLVLALVGHLLVRRQVREGWLLVSGGLSATLFGVLFGSLFCVEGVLPALWFHPLSHPLQTLGIPLILGVGVILGGFALEGLEFSWRRELGKWWRKRFGLILLYLGLGGMLILPELRWLALAGLIWVLAGGYLAGGGVGGCLTALGHLPETLMQLGVNTLSFSRVGAFALAHAGLSMAVISLAQLAGEGIGWWLVLLLGNVVILALEGLVVSIQTTRLILFEFFIRFLGGGGRVFRPLAPPLGESSLRSES